MIYDQDEGSYTIKGIISTGVKKNVSPFRMTLVKIDVDTKFPQQVLGFFEISVLQ